MLNIMFEKVNLFIVLMPSDMIMWFYKVRRHYMWIGEINEINYMFVW